MERAPRGAGPGLTQTAWLQVLFRGFRNRHAKSENRRKRVAGQRLARSAVSGLLACNGVPIEPGFNGSGRSFPPGALRFSHTRGPMPKSIVVRTRDREALERLRAKLESVSGKSVSRSAAVDHAIVHLSGCLGAGEDVQAFSVAALKRLMFSRTQALTATIAQAVATALRSYLAEAGHDVETHVGMSEDGRRIAARIVSAAPAPLPVGDDRIHPVIEA